MSLPMWLTRLPAFRAIPARKSRLLDGGEATQLLLNAEQFDRAAIGERMRVDRNGSILSILLISLPTSEGPVSAANLADTPDTQKLGFLCRVLEGRLRLTDTPGQLRDGRVGILLPDTPVQGAKHLAREICEVFDKDTVPPHWEVLSYPDQPTGIREGDAASQGNNNAHGSNGYHRPATSFDDQSAMQSSNGSDTESEVATPDVRNSEMLFALDLPRWKRSFDILGGSLGLVAASPVIGICAAAVLATSRGPAFFTQEREGHGGQRFKMYKIRTMATDAEDMKAKLRSESEQDGPAFKMTHDPRVTRIGRFLRKLSLDELPQLLNVIRGEMSLVGPRPLPVDESESCKPWQRQRLRIHPGITCTWQVKGRNTVSFEEWVRMDLEYLHQRSFWHDTKLLLQTGPALLFARGPR